VEITEEERKETLSMIQLMQAFMKHAKENKKKQAEERK